ncbi:MAG: hypothetical protein R3C68_16530 [Myxococcota bacterium]
MDKTEAKNQRYEAKKLRDEGQRAFEAGDYRLTKDLARQVVALMPKDSDLSRAAQADIERFSIDPWALWAGLGALTLVIVAWLVSVF